MPPRRSTRSSARPSAEPETIPPQKQAASSKRKRPNADNPDIEGKIEGQEDPGKPPSRTTRRLSSKAAPSVPAPRVSSRSKSVSHNVPDSESEEEEEELKELSHPAKRSRSSHHVLEDVHEENDEEDTKPIIAPRTRRAGSRPVVSSTNGKTGKDKIALTEDEPDEHVTAKPTSRTRSPGKGGNFSKPSTSRRSGRSSRSAAVTVKAEPLDEPTLESIDDIDGEEIEAPSQRRMTKRSSRKVKSSTPPRSVGKEDSGSDTNIDENATAVITNGAAPGALAEVSVPVSSPKKLSPPTPPVYEEKSLLDDLPTSPMKTKRPPAPLEELKGPGPRLVIHKLVLVNFKSYAGCQEIGPFHKVSCFRLVISKLIPCSLSLRSSDLMVLASRILSTRYSLCSDTVPAKCDKENCPNSYTTQHNIRICRSVVWKSISARLSTLYVHFYSCTTTAHCRFSPAPMHLLLCRTPPWPWPVLRTRTTLASIPSMDEQATTKKYRLFSKAVVSTLITIVSSSFR